MSQCGYLGRTQRMKSSQTPIYVNSKYFGCSKYPLEYLTSSCLNHVFEIIILLPKNELTWFRKVFHQIPRFGFNPLSSMPQMQTQ